MNKPVAIVLGGTVPHVSLTKKLKKRGYFVVLADFTKNPPAKEYADEHVSVSTLNLEDVLALAKEKDAQLVISTSVDQSNATCCYVAEKLSLPHPYSYETALKVTDKGLMKRVFVENAIPTSPFFTVVSLDDTRLRDVIYPAVVKPVDCNSSKGVLRVDNESELLIALEGALGLSRTHCAIVEGYNQGIEVQVDCLAFEDHAEVILTRQKRHIQGENSMVLQSVGSIVPAQFDETLEVQALEIANNIMSGFGLRNTPFFYQAIVTDNGLQVLEFAPRSGGGLSSYMLDHFVDYDVVEAGICSFLHEPIPPIAKKLDSHYLTTLLYMKAGVFHSVTGLENLKNRGLIMDYFVYRKSGAIVDGDMRSSNRIASFVQKAGDMKSLKEKYLQVINEVDIIDSDGESVLLKDLYRSV